MGNIAELSTASAAFVSHQVYNRLHIRPERTLKRHNNTIADNHLSRTARVSGVALWCLIEEDSAPFKATAPLDTGVNNLKKLIRGEL